MLRWSDHITNYAEIFLTLREEEEFIDCSIACNDGIVGAHKLVLAGCSPYLRDLLKRSNNPHPIIFLVDVARSTVLLLMEFIYRGQAHIPHDRLHDLVALGKSMQIKGLSQIQLQSKWSSVRRDIPRLHGVSDATLETSNDLNLGSRHSLSLNDVDHGSTPESDVSGDDSAEDSSEVDTPRRSSAREKTQESNNFRASGQKQEKSHQERKKTCSSAKNNNSQEKMKRSSIKKGSEGIVTDPKDYNTAVIGSKRKLNMNASDTQYGPRLKRKQTLKYEDLGSPTKKTGNAEPEKKKSMKKLPGRPKKVKQVKLPVFKVKKNPPPLGKIKCEPKGQLYKGGINFKLELGAFAVAHGIAASQSYIFAKYGVKIRRSTLEKMIQMHKEANKNKSKNSVDKEDTRGRPRKPFTLDFKYIPKRPRQSISFDVESLLFRSKKENEGAAKLV